MPTLWERLTPDDRDKMARRLRHARTLAKLTALDVSIAVGVHVNSVTHWELQDGRAAVPSADKRLKLAELYAIDEPALFRELAELEAVAARELLAG